MLRPRGIAMKNTCTHTRTRMHTFRVMWKSREELIDHRSQK